MTQCFIYQFRCTDETVLDWNKADWKAIRAGLTIEEWRNTITSANVTEAWDNLKYRLNQLVRSHVPLRKRRDLDKPPWMTKEILQSIRKKRKLWKKAK